ncbi:hypothetical protein [Winogradskyella pulchriflava]|uniref:HNH endonuclease n=1 Tax=Winogradskyella pulchriflava TaxID=1110688 RepID=A0ABV6Q8Q6_9FLAO
MSISLKTHKILWGKSGNRCSFPDCKVELVMDESESDNPSVVGQEAHIVGKKIKGPRGNSSMPIEDRDKYDNLILLCSIHHKLIDDQPNNYTVVKLTEFKKNHEEWVSKNLSIDKQKQKIELEYAHIIDKWVELGRVSEWKTWASNLLCSGQPSIRKEVYEKLRELQEFIFTRHWSGEIEEIEHALRNFNNVLNDFFIVFDKHKVKEDNWYDTERFYKTSFFEQHVYYRLLNEFNYHVDLTEDLVLELTRAGNRIIRAVRNNLFSTFRNDEGVLIIEYGPTMDLSWKTVRTEYLNYKEKEEFNYINLKDFMTRRKTRSYHFGEGESLKYLSERFNM